MCVFGVIFKQHAQQEHVTSLKEMCQSVCLHFCRVFVILLMASSGSNFIVKSGVSIALKFHSPFINDGFCIY